MQEEALARSEFSEDLDQLNEELDTYRTLLDDSTERPLANWFLKVLDECSRAEELVKQQSRAMLAAIERRRNAVKWKFGTLFRSVVDQELSRQKGRRKSVDFYFGRAGYRKSREKLVITDEQALVEWARQHAPEAIRESIGAKTPIIDAIKRTGELPPGCELREPQDTFYPDITVDNLIGPAQNPASRLVAGKREHA